jgi:flagellar hook-length control protein FliK
MQKELPAMPSSVTGFSSIFGPLVSSSQTASASLFAEQPAQLSASTSQLSQEMPQSAQVSSKDPGSFHNALKRAEEKDKPKLSGSKDSAKPEKTQAKPGANKVQKPRHATQQQHGKKSTGNGQGKPEGQTQSTPLKRGPRAAVDDSAQSQAQAGPGSPHADGSRLQTDQRTPQANLATPMAPPPPPVHHQPTKAEPAPADANKGAALKAASPIGKSNVRAVNPGPGPGPGTGDSNPAGAPMDAHAASNPAPPQDQLAAEADPGSAVAMATVAGAAGRSTASNAATGGASAPPDSGAATGRDNAAITSVAAGTSSATSGMSFLNDLASLSADAVGASAPAEKAAAKPGGAEPQPASAFAQALDTASAKPAAPGHTAAAPVEPTPDARFAQVNLPKIVSGVRGELMPGGGTMHLRLDPPQLGDLQISMHDGVMTAAFHTSNDEATRLLSHSLGNLKSMLEAQGVNVDKLHVQQAPKSNTGDSRDARDSSRREPSPEQQQADRREQQRKEMVQKMWDKLAGKAPVNLVA